MTNPNDRASMPVCDLDFRALVLVIDGVTPIFARPEQQFTMQAYSASTVLVHEMRTLPLWSMDNGLRG